MTEQKPQPHPGAHIVGWGMAVPERVLINDELAQMVDTSDEWIRQRTGIVERHVAREDETTFTFGLQAAQAALEVADLDPARLDLIVVATVTPDYAFPSTACLLQDALGAKDAAAFDLSAGCSGFVYGLSLVAGLLQAGTYEYVLVVGAETLSRITDWTDRNTCVLFGDGAGAVILRASQAPGGILSSVLGADGSGGKLLIQPAGGSARPASLETVAAREHSVRMDGRQVFRFATRAMPDAARRALKQAGLTVEDVSLFVPHQANDRILQVAAKSLGIPDERMYSNLSRYGNTSAASIPIALCEAADKGLIHRDDVIVCVGFGAGLTWAAAVIQWSVPLPVPAPSRRMTFQRQIRYRWAQLRARWRWLWWRIDARLFRILHNRNGTRKRRRRDEER